MRYLALNTGSSSFKWGLFGDPPGEPLDSGKREGLEGAEAVGAEVGQLIAELRTKGELADLAGVGHRVVHGGERLRAPVRITEAVKEEIARWSPLVPLHNPPALAGIAAAERALPQAPQVAAFDTGYFATLSEAERTYAIPWSWSADWGLRRFGFHGLSHQSAAARMAELGQGPLVITCHLGSGCSATASRAGRAVATTMGFTPLDGLMMGHRSGAVDPSLVLHLILQRGVSAEAVSEALEHRAGLAGVSGVSDDVRKLEAAGAEGNARAALALEMYSGRTAAAVAGLVVALGGVDALVFTAGVGEHAAGVRAAICSRLSAIGLALDLLANAAAEPERNLALPNSRAGIFVLTAKEELAVARATRDVLAG